MYPFNTHISKSSKTNWGLKQEALNTIYKEAILPLLMYGTPVWVGAMERNCNRTLHSRVQRVMNIKIAKAYCITSNDALYILTGNAPVELKTEEDANLYRITKDRQNQILDHETEHEDWTYPADTVRITEQSETMEHTIHISTDGSKTEQGGFSPKNAKNRKHLIEEIMRKTNDLEKTGI